MTNLRYEFAKLRTDFYLGGIQDRCRAGKSIPPPGYVIWDCTRRCNLNCLHCGAVKEKYARELSTEQIKGFLDQFAAMKAGMFALRPEPNPPPARTHARRFVPQRAGLASIKVRFHGLGGRGFFRRGG